MKLYELFDSLDYQWLCGDLSKEVKSLSCDSRNVEPQSLFFAIEGSNADGRQYIDEALNHGAVAVALEEVPCDMNTKSQEVSIIIVKDIRKALAAVANRFYDYPSDDLKMIGITGTKGKTSTAFLVQHLLECAGIMTGIIGTVSLGYRGNYEKSTSTTPNPIDLQKKLREMVNAGCKAVVMEVSSQGLMQSRVDGVEFNIGVFTNIFPDHIGKGEHRDFAHYLMCKKKLFDVCQKAVINGDDENWSRVVKNRNLKKRIFFGENEEYDFSFSDVQYCFNSDALITSFVVKAKPPYDNGQSRRITINLPGEFNVRNSLAAMATARLLGIPWDIITDALSSVRVPGRAELVTCSNSSLVMVDYAHNGKALRNLLESIKKYNPKRLIVVFGCGGERDRNRRFDMGREAYSLADYIIVTSDNPRRENPMDIIKDITSVMDFCNKTILAIPDRKEAIKRALKDALEGDIIVVAGKGHETYQIIGNEIIDFDDKQVILSCRKD